MNKKDIIVPKGYRYISDWKEYKLEDYNYPHILNKVLTGCGFTEYCLGNSQNLILTSPRKFLLENKEEQHTIRDENGNIIGKTLFYLRNESEKIVNYEEDISKDSKKLNQEKELDQDEQKKIAEYIQGLKKQVRDYAMECAFKHIPCKILVTYDSFRHVKEALTELGSFGLFQVVVDEFQSIFIDSRFKSDTELELLNHLRDIQKLCFVSATPMLDEYLDRLDEFKDLPYLEFDWKTTDPTRVKKPNLNIKFTTGSLSTELNRVIRNYQDGKFDMRAFVDSRGLPYKVESREAVFFMNSVTGICQAIRSNNLHLEDCNVLCAKTKKNEKRVRDAFNEVLKPEGKKLNRGISVIGKIPTKGEPHKMFTFCTRTVYLGADFYSLCAQTFIFSDSNVDCLAVDISMDLEQILGRQRLDENPWRNIATLFVKTTRANMRMTKEDFNKRIDEKIKKTNNLLLNYSVSPTADAKHDLAEAYQIMAEVRHYRNNYVAVNKHAKSDLLPVFNNLILVSEQRAFDVQQIDYADRFTVLNSLQDKELLIGIKEEVKIFAEKFKLIGNTSNKLEMLVEFGTQTEGITQEDMEDLFQLIPAKYKDYYTILGPDRLRTHRFREIDIKREILGRCGNVLTEGDVITEIYKTFEVGKRYTKADIKETLKGLYQRLGYTKTAKANDLESYFYLKGILTPDKKAGFEIIGKK